MFLMYWVDPKDNMLKVLCQYLYYCLIYRLNKENRHLVIKSTHPKLTQLLGFIHDVLDVVGTLQGSYAEILCQYLYYWLRYRINRENRPIVIMPIPQKLTHVPRVMHDICDIVGRPKGSCVKSFMSISPLMPEI